MTRAKIRTACLLDRCHTHRNEYLLRSLKTCYAQSMNIHDFAWHDGDRASVKPMRPVLSYAIKDRIPRQGHLKFRVKATITNFHHGAAFVPRNFTCSVSLQDDERDERERWREALRAMLIQECLARWHE